VVSSWLPWPDSRGVNGVAFGPDGGLLAAADGNGCVYLWDVASGELVAALANPGSLGVNDVACSVDGLVAAADCNGSVYLWKVRQ
jgi:WD40 repeat protein